MLSDIENSMVNCFNCHMLSYIATRSTTSLGLLYKNFMLLAKGPKQQCCEGKTTPTRQCKKEQGKEEDNNQNSLDVSGPP